MRLKPRLQRVAGIWYCESVDARGELLRAKGATVREAFGNWRFADRIFGTNPLFVRLPEKAKRNS